MKTCNNCANKDWCLITKPDRYYELKIFGGSGICPDYKEKETDMKSCKIINQSDFGYSDAQIHGEDNTSANKSYADVINGILERSRKKYQVDIEFDGGCGFVGNVIKIKIIDLNAVSLLNIVTEDNCRYSYNLATVISFRVTEEKENG